MEKIRIAVVEDEALIAMRLSLALESLGYEVLEVASSFTEGLEVVTQKKPDLIITDIGLSGRKTGIDLVKKIREFSDIPVLFLTSAADKQTIDSAHDASPNGYLIKPFRTEELYSSIELALKSRKEKTKILDAPKQHFVKTKVGLKKIEESEILFVRSEHVYVEVVCTGSKVFTIRKSLSEYVDELGSQFLRIHKSYVINLRHVSKITSQFIKIGEHELPIGKAYKSALKNFVKGE